MKKIKSIQALTKSVLDQENELKNILAEAILNLSKTHGNKDKRTISSSSNCFSIKLSELSFDLKLSALYYNFDEQYKEISKRILKAPLSRIEAVINEVTTASCYHKTVKNAVLCLWEGRL